MTQSKTPLLDRVRTPADLRKLPVERPQAARRRIARGDDQRRLGDRRASRRRARRRRADRGAALRVRHAARPADLGRRPSGLSAQDPDRAARPHPHAAPGRRPVRLHQARRERIRPVRRRPFLDLDLGRPRHGGGARSRARRQRRHRGDRRRRDVGRHGLRGDEQRRRPALAPDRHSQRQRHVDRAADRRDVGLSGAPRLQPHLSLAARRRQATGAPPAEVLLRQGQAHRGIRPRLLDRRHLVRGARLLLRRADRRPQSRPPAADPEERARHAATGRCWSTSSPRRARAIRPPRPPTTSTTASAPSTSSPARRRSRRPTRRPTPASSPTRWSPKAARDEQDRRHHRRDAAGHRARPLRRGLSRPDVRRRHRRAARRHLRGGPRLRRLQAVLRDLFDLPAARLRPGRARRGDPEPAGALRASIAPGWSARTARRTPGRSTSPIWPACPT